MVPAEAELGCGVGVGHWLIQSSDTSEVQLLTGCSPGTGSLLSENLCWQLLWGPMTVQVTTRLHSSDLSLLCLSSPPPPPAFWAFLQPCGCALREHSEDKTTLENPGLLPRLEG